MPEIKITLIESPDIPVIGVGEATTPKIMRVLHDILEIDVTTFHALVKPTWKLGIKFFWGTKEKDYFNLPFGHVQPIHAYYLTKDINNCSIVSNLMSEELSPVMLDDGGEAKMISNRSFAYHIDNKAFVSFLRKMIKDSDIEYIQGEIKSVKVNGNGIELLNTKSGNTLSADLYMDCSGFGSILLGKAMETEYISYKSSLFTDRAVTAVLDNKGFIKPYTSAITMRSGWMWNIPLQDHDHLGYVYSSEYCDRTEAETELLNVYPEAQIKPKTVHFKSGRYESFIAENVVGIGNAYGFVEPLESTGLHMICFEILELIEVLKKNEISTHAKSTLNQKIGRKWDMLRWFLAIHYKYNKRIDSQFWRDCNEYVDVSGVAEYIDHYLKSGPISFSRQNRIHHELNFDSIFSPVGFDAILLGQNIFPHWENIFISDKEKAFFEFTNKVNQSLLAKALPMQEALEIASKETDLISLNGWFDKPNSIDS